MSSSENKRKSRWASSEASPANPVSSTASSSSSSSSSSANSQQERVIKQKKPRYDDDGTVGTWGTAVPLPPDTSTSTSNPDDKTTNPNTETKDGKDKTKHHLLHQPSFAPSGALASDESSGITINGTLLLHPAPSNARIPNTKYRLYVYKNNVEIECFHISKQEQYVFGREEKEDIVDVVVAHGSLSRQHCCLVYRLTPPPSTSTTNKMSVKPYIIDLASTNGTYLNGKKIEAKRYYELRSGDCMKLGESLREYVFISERDGL